MSIDLNSYLPRPSMAEVRAAVNEIRARHAAAREAEFRAKRLADEEGQRLTVVLAELWPLALESYRRQGGRGVLPPLQWGPPLDKGTEDEVFGDLL